MKIYFNLNLFPIISSFSKDDTFLPKLKELVICEVAYKYMVDPTEISLEVIDDSIYKVSTASSTSEEENPIWLLDKVENFLDIQEMIVAQRYRIGLD